MASPIMPAPIAPAPFYTNMARKRQMMLDAQKRQKEPGALPRGPLPMTPTPDQMVAPGGIDQTAGGVTGGGSVMQMPGAGGAFTGAPSVPPLDGGLPGGMGGMRRPPVAQPPLGGGFTGGLRQPPVMPVPIDQGGAGAARNLTGPMSPIIPTAPPIQEPGGDMGVPPATLEAEKKKGQQDFFRRRPRQPQIPTPGAPPVFERAGQVIDR